jgi:hypothetical protein
MHVGHQPLGAPAQQALLKLDRRECKQNNCKHSYTRDAENAENPLLAGHPLCRHRQHTNCS